MTETRKINKLTEDNRRLVFENDKLGAKVDALEEVIKMLIRSLK